MSSSSSDARRVTDVWPRFAASLAVALDRQWEESPPTCFWSKCDDGTLVSDFDVEVDVLVRRYFTQFYPGVPLLSEELGWMTSPGAPAGLMAILDPVDGTSSLARAIPEWWISLAVRAAEVPVAGLIYQPVRRVLHDSMKPSPHARARTGRVGMNPDQLGPDSPAAAQIRAAGFEPTAVPHAVEKVAAVIEGRLDAGIYLPSRESPDWRSWDIAACLSLARANDMLRSLRRLAQSDWMISRPGSPTRGFAREATRCSTRCAPRSVDRCRDDASQHRHVAFGIGRAKSLDCVAEFRFSTNGALSGT